VPVAQARVHYTQLMNNDCHYLLQAKTLSRRISPSAEVAEVSLRLRKGDVLGLLGLNGAGKSTTLKMLAGLLVPDSGSIAINGFSLSEHPLEARAALGYLPDTPPLYPDMRVSAYLKLAAELRRVPRRRVRGAIDRALEVCDLGDVSKHRIAALSKGFRQRVGLAQAIIHRPKLILLDEPSSGLDPHQMQSMRALIKTLGEDAAVIFSTHLLPEAVAVCNHIAVMHHGRIVASELKEDDGETNHKKPLARDQLDMLFANLVQFGTPTAPVTTLTVKANQASANQSSIADVIDA